MSHKYKCSCITNPSKVSSDNVYYAGAYLSNLDILPNEYLTSILQKINDYQFSLECVACDSGIPIFPNVTSAFLLGTNADGKVIENNDVYSKDEVDTKIISKAAFTKFIVGDGSPNSPSDGDIIYNNPALAGVTEAIIIRNGLPLFEDEDGIDYIPTGGFRLTLMGDVFTTGEKFVFINLSEI